MGIHRRIVVVLRSEVSVVLVLGVEVGEMVASAESSLSA